MGKPDEPIQIRAGCPDHGGAGILARCQAADRLIYFRFGIRMSEAERSPAPGPRWLHEPPEEHGPGNAEPQLGENPVYRPSSSISHTRAAPGSGAQEENGTADPFSCPHSPVPSLNANSRRWSLQTNVIRVRAVKIEESWQNDGTRAPECGKISALLLVCIILPHHHFAKISCGQ